MSAQRRLAALVAGHGLTDGAAAALERLLALVAEDDTAPTTVRDPAVAVDAHIADSLAGLAVPELREARVVADLGAGAGFPGLVLAAALPEARVVLVESTGRKCAFLEAAIEATGLANAEVACARVEEWTAGIGVCDAVTARAVAPLGVLAEYAAPLLRPGGVLVAYKGIRDDAEEAGANRAAEVLGLGGLRVDPVEPFPGADHRHLYVYSKVRDTPSRFPRRPGMARKRPL